MTSIAFGQESRAVIVGRVTDVSGAAVPGAKVIAKSRDTNISTTTTADAEGGFQLNYLQPGGYRLSVEATGFKTIVRDNLDVRVGDRLALDFTLEVGAVSDTVNITTEAPLLDTTSANAGMVIDGKRAAELPVVGGNAFYLSRLAPGVVTAGGRSAGNPFDYGSGSNLIGNGSRSGTSEVTLDGSPNMFERSTSFSPPQDLVAEFKIQTTSYDASIGHASGALTNVSVKSGTKDLHGTAYMNDSRLRAIPWHTNRFLGIQTAAPGANVEQIRDRNVPSWLHQRWGATATGPVVIPKVYNGRAKTFWSFGYEGLKINRNLSFTGTMPTEKQRNGDFSDLLRLGATYQIYDPFTIRPAAQAGRFARDPIVGNIIPANRISPIAKSILAYFPLPNQPGSADGRQNYFTTQKIRRSNRNFLGRVDHSFNDKHRMFARYTQNYQYDTTVQFEGGATGTIAEQPGRGVAVDDVYTFSPTLIMNTRYSVSHQTPIAGRLTNGFDLTSLGFSAALVNEIKTKNNFAGVSFPSINITNFTSIGQDGGNQRSIYYHVFGNTITKIINNHSMKFGGEYRLQRENGFGYGNVAPTFTFAEAYTRGPLDNSPVAPIGHGLASFLLGVPTGGSVSINASRAMQADFFGGFVHDDWRINKRLTINAGIRYELEGAPTERFNRALLGFDPTLESPIAAQALTNYRANPIAELPVANFKTTGGLIFAGTSGQPRAQYTRDKNNWMPRLGLAFSINTKTVLRAGIGVYYDTVGIDRDDGSQLGFSQSTPLIPTNNNGQTYVASLANPFPNGFQTPTGAALGVRTFLGRGINASTNPFIQGKPLNPYNTRWSMAVQRELPGRLVAEITYVGSRANKLGLTRALNALPLQYLSTKTERDQATIDFLGAQVRNPFLGIAEFVGTPLGNQTVSRSQLLRPFPHFQDIFINESSGYAWYHSMQAGVEKRLTKGLTFQASLTWSKFMQATEFLNEADLRPSEVISDQDYPWRFAINGIYELPFGKGKKFLGNANRWVDAALGGWQFQGWFEGQSGEALGFGNAILRGNVRDMIIPVGQRTTDCWFRSGVVSSTISCPWKGSPVFETDPAKQLGSNLRTLPLRFSYLRADGTNNFDLSLFKNYKITEKFKVQFRAESFNALNHVQFANPTTGIQNTALGTITGEKGHGQRQWTFGLKLMF